MDQVADQQCNAELLLSVDQETGHSEFETWDCLLFFTIFWPEIPTSKRCFWCSSRLVLRLGWLGLEFRVWGSGLDYGSGLGLGSRLGSLGYG